MAKTPAEIAERERKLSERIQEEGKAKQEKFRLLRQQQANCSRAGSTEEVTFFSKKWKPKGKRKKRIIEQLPVVLVNADPAYLRSLPYAQFLETEYWKTVRRIVLKRDNFQCRSCGNHRCILHVHHLSYEHHGQEHLFLEDLVSLCVSCHEHEHSN